MSDKSPGLLVGERRKYGEVFGDRLNPPLGKRSIQQASMSEFGPHSKYDDGANAVSTSYGGDATGSGLRNRDVTP